MVGGEYQDYSQVIDIHSAKSCSDFSSYPLKMYGASGGVLNGSPLVCGGLRKLNTLGYLINV